MPTHLELELPNTFLNIKFKYANINRQTNNYNLTDSISMKTEKKTCLLCKVNDPQSILSMYINIFYMMFYAFNS